MEGDEPVGVTRFTKKRYQVPFLVLLGEGDEPVSVTRFTKKRYQVPFLVLLGEGDEPVGVTRFTKKRYQVPFLVFYDPSKIYIIDNFGLKFYKKTLDAFGLITLTLREGRNCKAISGRGQ